MYIHSLARTLRGESHTYYTQPLTSPFAEGFKHIHIGPVQGGHNKHAVILPKLIFVCGGEESQVNVHKYTRVY